MYKSFQWAVRMTEAILEGTQLKNIYNIKLNIFNYKEK